MSSKPPRGSGDTDDITPADCTHARQVFPGTGARVMPCAHYGCRDGHPYPHLVGYEVGGDLRWSLAEGSKAPRVASRVYGRHQQGPDWVWQQVDAGPVIEFLQTEGEDMRRALRVCESTTESYRVELARVARALEASIRRRR